MAGHDYPYAEGATEPCGAARTRTSAHEVEECRISTRETRRNYGLRIGASSRSRQNPDDVAREPRGAVERGGARGPGPHRSSCVSPLGSREEAHGCGRCAPLRQLSPILTSSFGNLMATAMRAEALSCIICVRLVHGASCKSKSYRARASLSMSRRTKGEGYMRLHPPSFIIYRRARAHASAICTYMSAAPRAVRRGAAKRRGSEDGRGREGGEMRSAGERWKGRRSPGRRRGAGAFEARTPPRRS